jgi:hypothetical protein
MPIEPFYMVVLDHEEKLYNIIGPITDDTDITNSTAEAIHAVRQVNCYTLSRDRERAIPELMADIERSHAGYTYSSEPIIPA